MTGSSGRVIFGGEARLRHAGDGRDGMLLPHKQEVDNRRALQDDDAGREDRVHNYAVDVLLVLEMNHFD